MVKKTGGLKSRWTVPLNSNGVFYIYFYFVNLCLHMAERIQKMHRLHTTSLNHTSEAMFSVQNIDIFGQEKTMIF